MPESLSLPTALDNSRKDQTYNTPAVATLILLEQQLDWMNSQGGLDWCVRRTTESSSALYDWAAAHRVRDAVRRRPGQALAGRRHDRLRRAVDAAAVAKALRANGIVDTEPYRKLGRNQLRIGMFPAVEPDDVRALTACIDFVVEQVR